MVKCRIGINSEEDTVINKFNLSAKMRPSKRPGHCLILAVSSSFLLVFMTVSTAQANVKQIKLYKEAYSDATPKCIHCHVDKLPKKDDMMHELSDYGKKVVSISAEPTADTYKTAGPYEEEL